MQKINFLEFETTPHGEPCEQVGDEYDPIQARKEAKAHINQMIRMFGEPPQGARFVIKSVEHDFGGYLEIRCYFDENVQEAIDYAFKIENDAPEFWDDIAREELKPKPINV